VWQVDYFSTSCHTNQPTTQPTCNQQSDYLHDGHGIPSVALHGGMPGKGVLGWGRARWRDELAGRCLVATPEVLLHALGHGHLQVRMRLNAYVHACVFVCMRACVSSVNQRPPPTMQPTTTRMHRSPT
jgi:hypothetical protein